MKSALFTNFTNEDFTGYWDGKAKLFKPGSSLYMPVALANHHAKHLVNRELLRIDDNGSAIHRNGDKMTSPKFPEQVPIFMDLFNKAVTLEGDIEQEENIGDFEEVVTTMNKNKAVTKKAPVKKTVTKEEDDEFEGKPIE